MMSEFLRQLRTVPEYFLALKGAVAVLAMGLPLYVGLRYFLYRRRLAISWMGTLNFVSVFVLFAGLAFLLASPLATHLPQSAISAYLFLTCLAASFGAVSLIDVFVLQHYLSNVKRIYVSPPLRTVINLSVFSVALLLVLRFVLHFNPLALIAIPTIATAGVALALQDTLKTFIAGLSLGHMIRIGEWISFQDKEGRVIDINWARTVIETLDGQRVFVPNTMLQTGIFLNFTAGSPANRMCFKVSAAYDAPPPRVKETLLRCLQSVPGVGGSPPPLAALLEYTDSGIVYGLYYWIDDYTRRLPVQDEVATRVWYAFQREGIAIPYPTRTLYLHRTTGEAWKAQAHVEEALKGWNLADAFHAEELQKLSLSARSRVYAPGEIIVRKGDPGHSLFTIVEGQAEVYGTMTLDRPIATLNPHETFGEMSLLTGEPRSATVRAKTSMDVLEIEKEGLQTILAQRPEISNRLAELVVKRQAVLAAVAPQNVGAAAQATNARDNQPLAKRIREFFGLA